MVGTNTPSTQIPGHGPRVARRKGPVLARASEIYDEFEPRKPRSSSSPDTRGVILPNGQSGVKEICRPLGDLPTRIRGRSTGRFRPTLLSGMDSEPRSDLGQCELGAVGSPAAAEEGFQCCFLALETCNELVLLKAFPDLVP